MEVTLGLYTSLCQYFSEQEKRWKTEGIIPLEETRPDQAVCLTQHLTAFGASLFVPPNSVQFIFPVSNTKQKLCSVATLRADSCHLDESLGLPLASHSSWAMTEVRPAELCLTFRPAQVPESLGELQMGTVCRGAVSCCESCC